MIYWTLPEEVGTSLADDLSSTVPLSLLRVREIMLETIRPILFGAGQAEAQWRVLRVLYAEHAPLDFAALANAAVIRRASLTRVIKTLTEEGLVVANPNPNDQRLVLLEMTDEGRDHVRELSVQIQTEYRKLSDRLGSERLTQLRTLLGEIQELATE